MKALKYWMSVLTVVVSSICFFSCADEFDRRKEGLGDGKSLFLSIYVPDNEVVNPMTKSDKNLAEKIDNLAILIYQEGKLNAAASQYIDDPTTLGTLKMTGDETLSRVFTLGEGTTGKVYAIANAGNVLNTYANEVDLQNASFELDGLNPRFIFFADGKSFDVATNPQVEASLVRIYSKISVVVNTDNLSVVNGKQVVVTPKSVKLYNIPVSGTLKSPNLITESEKSKREGEMLMTKDAGGSEPYWNAQAEEADGVYSSVLYMYENMQPKGFCNEIGGAWDQTTKTPAEFKSVVTSRDIVMTTTRASFIEVVADYSGPNTVSGSYGGTIKYRFFLGKNSYDNFEVARNTHYKITLNLHGNGGVEEATWRVEIDKIPFAVSLSDIYVGYRAGSVSPLIVPGDVDNVSTVEVAMVSNPNTDTGGFDSNWATNGSTESGLLTITAQSTNVHSYKQKIAKVTFTMKDGKTKYSANIYQVPRLVDPIAIYKRATNADETEITVREYNPDAKPGRYQTLVSKGPWSAIIKESVGGNWFTIYIEDKNSKKYTAVKVGDTIKGEDEINFFYKPKDANNTETDRFGMIQVKYHNNWCEHEIYLRQGYRPVIMEEAEGSEWSAFNCLGEDRNGAQHATTSPTQTGWLFNGGVNKAMHPFIPGYRDGGKEILYSDGVKRKMGEIPTSISAWEIDKNGSINNATSGSSIGKQGPCPDGYIVPNAWKYRAMTEETEIATGYVYDDDYSGTRYETPDGRVTYGWSWNESTGDAEVDDNNHCNPAKGSLFIKKSDRCTNLFFGYGKGVLTDIRDKDSKLVAEIGVGHRYNKGDGSLTYSDHTVTTNKTNHAYGGFYWNATNFQRYVSSGAYHMGKVDFGYDVFKREPNLLDVPGQAASVGGGPALGISGEHNGSFVRCIRSSDKNIRVLAMFDFTGVAHDYMQNVILLGKYQQFLVSGGNLENGFIPSNMNSLVVEGDSVQIVAMGTVIGTVFVSVLTNSKKKLVFSYANGNMSFKVEDIP